MELLFSLIGTKCCSFTLAAVRAVLVHTLGALVVWVPTTNLPHLSSTHDDDRGAFTMMRDLIIAQRCVSIRSCSETTIRNDITEQYCEHMQHYF